MPERYAHFIGCGGAGTQPLALLFHELGYRCSGSDLIENGKTEELRRVGVRIFTGHRAENLPEKADSGNAVVIHTSAAKPDNPEILEAERRGIPLLRRGAALAKAAEHFPLTIAVAGSHGKTTTTAVIVHILRELGENPGFLIGGTVRGREVSGTAGGGRIFVSEVDESDSTNALFRASLAVVTNVEDDHCWSVGGVEALFESFRTFARNAGKLLYVEGSNCGGVFREFGGKSTVLPEKTPDLAWPPDWGGFQKQDAYTAIRACALMFPEHPMERIVAAAVTFPGVERRMSLRFDNGIFRVMEDYAHHPTEVAASLRAFRETNPGRRLVVIFQPHRYARLKRYLPEFIRILSTADRVFVAPVFAAWTDSSDVDSGTLVSGIGAKASLLSGSWEAMGKTVRSELGQGDLAALIGAGDLPEILPYLR